MRCLECGADIENGVYTCEYCGTHFGEEDVLIMLGTEKKRRKARARKTIMLALLFIASIYLIVGGALYLVGKSIKEKEEAALKEYNVGLEEYLSSMPEIESYEYEEDSIFVVVLTEYWEQLTETEKIEVGKRLQDSVTRFRNELGLVDVDCITVQINDEFDNMMLYADNAGRIQTFEPPQG